MDVDTNKIYIGIDLGTSNSLCTYIYSDAPKKHGKESEKNSNGNSEENITILEFDQLRDFDQLISQETLPSFCFLPETTPLAVLKNEREKEDSAEVSSSLGKWIPGEIAKRQSTETPERVIHSAKSWLSVRNVDKHASILPWHSSLAEDEKISPLEAQTIYLSFIRKAFTKRFSSELFDAAKIAITIPASFSEEASYLTKLAATKAGFPETTIYLDEPQAALFANIEHIKKAFKNNKPERPLILVCDIGGGTTDFSIYSYQKKSQTPFERIKIGSHLLLGGDNIDAAIAHKIQETHNLSFSKEETLSLIQESRLLKEKYFGTNEIPETVHISIGKKGGNLFTSSKTIEVQLRNIFNFIVQGFFPDLETIKKEAAERESHPTLSDFGLPLEEEPAITRHLDTFLEGIHIDAVLFNGGTMECAQFNRAIISFIESLQGSAPRVISSTDFSRSVSKGATQYVRTKDLGISLVKAGYPRNLYLLVEDGSDTPKAVCILEKGEEREEWISLSDQEFSVLLNKECSFTLLSRTNSFDTPGSIHIPDSSFEVLSQLSSIIELPNEIKKTHSAQELPVFLEIKLSSLRIVEIRLKNNTFNIEFPLTFKRGSYLTKSSQKKVLEKDTTSKNENAIIKDLIIPLFGKKQKSEIELTPSTLIKSIEKSIKLPKEEWETQTLRNIADLLLPFSSKRSRSLPHEMAWLHLAGYSLRPGFGYENDNQRIELVQETARLGLYHKKEKNAQSAWAIFWRRIAGGLSKQMQDSLFKESMQLLKKNKFSDPEHIRLICCLEEVSKDDRVDILETLYKRCHGKSNPSEAELWGIARLISRHSVRNEDSSLLSQEIANQYVKKMLDLSLEKNKMKYLIRMLLLSQEIRGDTFDIPKATRELLNKAAATYGINQNLSENGTHYSADSLPQSAFLHGDALPLGISIKL